MIDPVTQDLNRHIADMEKSDALAEAEEAKVEEMIGDLKTVKEILEEMMCDESIDLPSDLAAVMTTNPADRLAHLALFFDRLTETVRIEAKRLAPGLVEADINRAEADEAEAKAMDKEDRDNGY